VVTDLTGPKRSTSPSRLVDRLPDPRDMVLTALMLFGVWLSWKAMNRYPWLDANPSPLGLAVPGMTFLLVFALLTRARRTLMPWGLQKPILMWGGMAGIAAGVAILATGLLFFANGALDRSPPNYVKFVISKKKRWDTNFVLAVRPAVPLGSTSRLRSSIYVTRDDWELSSKDSVVLVDVRPGFLHIRWTAGYRLCETEPSEVCQRGP
jgi:hypothetical protein